MVALQADAEAHGAIVALNTKLLRGRRAGGAWVLDTATTGLGASAGSNRRSESSSGGGDHSSISDGDGTSGDSSDAPSFFLQCDTVVNCAGLAASEVALALGCPPHTVPRTYCAKGNYFALQGVAPPPFARLVYPLPDGHAGLGVHATVDLGGRVRFGPDVEWVESRHPNDGTASHHPYRVDPLRAAAFYDEVRKYWPSLPDGALVPDYAGLRPKLHGPPGKGEPQTATDFFFQGASLRSSKAANRDSSYTKGGFFGHGLPGLVNLLGFESPGLTAALAIADEVAFMLQGH
jgi:L-2-hydroxyglutarate oxidase LhgO